MTDDIMIMDGESIDLPSIDNIMIMDSVHRFTSRNKAEIHSNII
jgi:hypothetical protein